MDENQDLNAIIEATVVTGVTYVPVFDDVKYHQLYATSQEQYDTARAFLLLHGLNVGDYKENMLGWLMFRVYKNGDEVDIKNDKDY